MLREGQYKFVYYVGYRPQLFDLESDSQELNDLVETGSHTDLVETFEKKLRDLLDPEEIDALAKADQNILLNKHGGKDAVMNRGTFTNSPVPGEKPQFNPGLKTS